MNAQASDKLAAFLRSPQTQRALSYIIFVLFAWRSYDTLTGHFQTHWHLDFKYFWQAGHSWLNGQSPYLSSYVSEGSQYFPGFLNPFFYPPAILPLLAPLGAMEPLTAAYMFFTVNVILIVIASFLLSRLASALWPQLNAQHIFLFFLLVLSIYIRPVTMVMIYGQFTIVLCAAFMGFLYAAVRQQRIAAGGAIAVMLLKPHIGLGLLVYALCKKDLRPAGVYAIAITAVFTALGLAADNPIGSVFGYLNGLQDYSAKPENMSAYSGGLGALLGLTGLSLSPIITLIAVTIIPALIALAQTRSNDRIQNLAAACFIVTWSLFVARNHSTDFVLLAPLALFLFPAYPFAMRVLLCACLLYLWRSWDIARMTLQSPTETGVFMTAIGHTIALMGVMIFLIRQILIKPHPSPNQSTLALSAQLSQ